MENMSTLIESACERNKEFKELVECRDSDIFMTIPSLLVLRTLDEEKGEA